MKTPHKVPSRREFLATSALGVLGLASGALRGRLPAADEELLYVGTYTENTRSQGIYLLRMDSRTGALRHIGAAGAGVNPSYLAIHPNGRVLYAVNEVMEFKGRRSGAVSAFAIAGETGALMSVGQQPSEGAAPCYVSVDRHGRALLVANYVGGNVALLPLRAGGFPLRAADVERHRGRGPNRERQEAPHAHCIIPDPSNRFALAADLGADRVLVYRLDLERRSLRHVERADARLTPGSGPRHLAFHKSLPLVYVASELSSTVTALRFDRETGQLSVGHSLSTLPSGWSGASYVADIHVAPSGNALYVSNRGHNSIAVFSVDSAGGLALEQVMSTGGDWPRNFSLDPSGNWLLVANQRSGDIVVFARDPGTGRLTGTSQRIAVPSPVCLRFRAHAGEPT